MLPAVKALGDYACRSESLSAESMFIESSKLEDVKNVLCINFEQVQGKIIYKNIFQKSFNQKDSIKYLYRTHRRGTYDITPTSKIASPEKAKNRFKLWFKLIPSDYLKDELLFSLKEEFLKNIDQIFNDFEKEYLAIKQDTRKNTILTVTIEEGAQIKYLGDIEIFRNILKKEGYRVFYTRKEGSKSVEARGDGICAICGRQTEVMGFASPFSVYTFDKRGFAPNFLRKDAWKRLPLCGDCATSLSAGKDFTDKYFYKNLYGLNFYVIPDFNFDFNDEVIDTIKSPKKSYKTLLCREDDITLIMAEKEVNLIFVFTKQKKAYFDIMRYVEDVPPSWIRKIKTIEEIVYNEPIFKEPSLKLLFGQKWFGDLYNAQDLSLGKLVREFFPSSKIQGIYDKYFIDILSAILAQRKIRSSLLINAFSRTIRLSFIKGNDFSTNVLSLKSLMLILLLDKLELWNEWSNQVMDTQKEDTLFSQFFEEYENAFNTPSKRAAFLEGVLTKYLLDVQFANRGSTPFREKLFGLRLDERRVKSLFPETIQKLREYKVAYTDLEKATAKVLVDSENKGWNLTSEETSYFFALGMTLAPIFKVTEEKLEE
jgi:CRISPR-associated protein Csh1